MATIDELTIEVQTKAKDANGGIDALAKGLEKLAGVVEKIQSGKLKSIGRGIEQLSNGMKGLKDVKLPNYTRLSNGLSELAKVDSEKLKTVSDALNPLANSIQTLSSANFDGKNIQVFVNSITRLSNANTESLKNINFTALGDSIKGLAGTLSGAEKVQQNTISMTNAIAKLANAGDKANVVKDTLPGLGASLKDFMNTMSSAPKAETETIQFTQAIGTLANAGKKAETTAGNLGKLGQETLKLIQSLSDAPRVSSNTISLVQAISQLANAGGRAGISSNNLGGNLGKLSKSMIGIRGSTIKAVTSLKSFATQIAASMGVYLGIYGAIRGLKKAVDLSSDLTEVQNVVNVTFGNMTNKVEEFAQTSIKTFGMSELATKQFSSRFQAMGTAMGINPSLIGNANKFLSEQTNGYVGMSDSMSDVSLNLTKLTADMASFYNVEQAAVAEDLAAIFTGQTRPLRTYGLDLTQATLAEWALKHGMDADIKSMSQAEKTMLRYQYVLANTTASHGDFAKTAGTWANQVRILSQQFQQFGSIVGKGVIAAFKPFIQTLNKVMAKVITFSENVLNALGKIFGWKFEITGGGLTGDLGDTAGYTDDIASGAGDASDGYKDAAKNAKKLKDVVLGIDELNINAPDNDTGSTGGSSGKPSSGGLGDLGAGAGGGLNTNMFATDTVLKAYESSIDSLYKLGEYIRDTLIKTMDGIEWGKVYERARGFGKGLADFLNGLFAYNGDGKTLFGQVGTTLANTLNTVVYSALSFGQRFDSRQFGINVADGINNVFKNFNFEALAQTLNVWVDGLWDFIGGFLGKIKPGDVFKGIKEFLGTLDLDTLTIIIGAIAWKLGAGVIIKNTLLALISKGISGLVLNLTGVELGKVTFAGVAKAIGVALKNALAGISGTIISTISSALGVSGGAAVAIFAGVIAGIVAVGVAIKDLWDTSESFRQSVSEMWKKIAGAFSEAKTAIWDNALVPLWGNIKSLIEAMKGAWSIVYQAYDSSGLKYVFEQMLTFWGDTLSTKIANAIKIIGVVFETVGGVVGGIIEILAGAINFVTGNFSGDWKKAWQGAKNIVKGASDSIASVLSGLWETIKIIFAPTIKYFSENFTGAYNAVKSAFSFIDTWFDEKWKAIKAVFSLTVQFFSETFTNGYNAVKAAFSFINTWFQDKWNAVKNVFRDVKQFFKEKFETGYNAVKAAFNAINTWFSDKWGMVKGVFRDVKSFFSDAFQNAYNAVTRIWDGIGGYFKGIANNIISPIGKAVNGVINGINWVLEKVGSNTRLKTWDVPTFATGTNGLPRDTIGVVNDQAGSTYKELIVPPSGKPFIPEGRNVVLPMEKGTKIMPAKQTKAFMEGSGMPHFAGGIGNFLSGAWEAVKSFTGNVMDYLTKPREILKVALDKFVDISGWAGIYGDIASGAVNKVFDSAVSYIKGIFDTVVPHVNYTPSAGVEQWRQLASHALKLTNQFTEANVNALLMQMQHESGGNPNAINNWDINAKRGTPSKGLMQVIDPTFRAYALAPYNTNIYDPLSNMIASIRYTVSRYGSLYNGWTARGYKGYASGIGKIKVDDLFPKYEVGGFPEDGLFMANHDEIVGRFSNGRTAVANDYQIEKGVEEATYRGYMRAHAETRETALLEEIRDAIREGRSISIDGREIVRAYDSRKARNGFSFA